MDGYSVLLYAWPRKVSSRDCIDPCSPLSNPSSSFSYSQTPGKADKAKLWLALAEMAAPENPDQLPSTEARKTAFTNAIANSSHSRYYDCR